MVDICLYSSFCLFCVPVRPESSGRVRALVAKRESHEDSKTQRFTKEELNVLKLSATN